MSLTRSPSPFQGGGWSSPGLAVDSRCQSPLPSDPSGRVSSSSFNMASLSAAKAKSEEKQRYPSFSTRNSGFFSRQKHKLSVSLPRFHITSSRGHYTEKEKLGCGRWQDDGSRHSHLVTLLTSLLRQRRFQLLLAAIALLICYLTFWSALVESYRRSPLSGGSKTVILIASNIEGGVMEWKGSRQWAIERMTLRNKREYAKRWGHKLEVLNLMTRRKYAHEWREGWEKADMIRDAMKKYPDAEWFWWLDHHTFIMEHSYSLHNHVFKSLDSLAYRDINVLNPLNITHPLSDFYLDSQSQSINGGGDSSSINLILTQDCIGFSLGSFLMRRSVWTDRLLDIWWDPVIYEQKHMEWPQREQDSLVHLYASQPWIRAGVAFLPQRRINSYPPGACGNGSDLRVHYQEADRDFVINMAGCEFGRDCWEEMQTYMNAVIG